MEVELVRQRTITKTTKELQRERRCTTTWQREKTKSTREVIVRERTRKPPERPQLYKPRMVNPMEKQQKARTTTVRNKTVERTKNNKEKLLVGTIPLIREHFLPPQAKQKDLPAYIFIRSVPVIKGGRFRFVIA
ncbi:hypothetical protein CEXT_595211 [Caerostris extrusa]|uniref:Uncharacterized protein n=1 Tax=Caerostris extrusa TaxID=172846 RepID=A0AAV4QWZ2_CAEEX|nr:hypothetical protein CEXT_595211 [Caerostris extrusa]